MLLDGIQWADKAVENLDSLDVFAIDLFRFGYQNLVQLIVSSTAFPLLLLTLFGQSCLFCVVAICKHLKTFLREKSL